MGYFSWPTRNRRIVEWDQIYDQQNFGWATDGSATKMDFDSIATHELGHSFGMGDLYQIECTEQTMYGYGSEGEAHSRTLEIGDITGISKLY